MTVNDNENIEVVDVEAATPSIVADSQQTSHQEEEEESKSVNQVTHDTNDAESNQELTEEDRLETRRNLCKKGFVGFLLVGFVVYIIVDAVDPPSALPTCHENPQSTTESFSLERDPLR